MDNASKALIMAGEVLIGVIILSILVFMFNKVNEFTESYFANSDRQKLIAFNAEFTKYITNNTADNATYIYAEDVVTIINQAREWNAIAPNASEQIIVRIFNEDRVNLDYDLNTLEKFEQFDEVEFFKKYKLRDNPEDAEYQFSCQIALNTTTGRVRTVKIGNKGEKTT